MAIKGVTFDGQNVTPFNDGALYAAHYGDGILDGCTMSVSGDNLVIQAGHIIAGGRVCQVDGATQIDLSERTLSNGYIQVVLNYDLSQAEGEQWYTTFFEQASLPFGDLTHDDINGTGTLYQVQLAIVQIANSNLVNPPNAHMGYSFVYAQNENGQIVGMKMPQSGYLQIGAFENGSIRQGIVRNSAGNTLIVAPQMDIILRPNGWEDNTNQFRFYPDGHAVIPSDCYINGQQIGGHAYSDESDTNVSVSLSAGSWVNTKSISGLATGVYMALGYIKFTPNSNSGGQLLVGIGTNTTEGGQCIASAYFNGTSAAFMTVPLLTGSATQFKLWVQSSVAGKINLRRIRYVRLA